jgi:hypothetical protein
MKEGWIRIFFASELYQVKIAEDKLNQHDIESHIVNKGDSAIPSIGEVELYTQPENVEEALKVLREAGIKTD